MTDETDFRDLDPDQAERLLDAAARGAAPGSDRLAALLRAAAATPEQGGPLAGEERMLAEYRAAAPPTPKSTPGHRPVWKTVAAAIAALALGGITVGGIALAAEQARLIRDTPRHGSPSVPVTTTPTQRPTSGRLTPPSTSRSAACCGPGLPTTSEAPPDRPKGSAHPPSGTTATAAGLSHHRSAGDAGSTPGRSHRQGRRRDPQSSGVPRRPHKPAAE
jgi:hypothetical protein